MIASPVVGAAGALGTFSSGPSVLSLGEVQSGSSMSISPSPSLSIPSAHWGGAGTVAAGRLGVVVAGGTTTVGAVLVPDPVDPDPLGGVSLLLDPPSRPSVTEARGDAAGAVPTAASARKAASARISASLLLMRLEYRCHGRSRLRPIPLPAGSSFKLSIAPVVGNVKAPTQ